MAESRIRPLIILPKNQVSPEDIARLNDNGLCVIEAEDPSLVRFMEPPPLGYDVREKAAIALFRRLMGHKTVTYNRADVATLYVDLLLNGSPLEPIIDTEHVPVNQPKRK